MAYFCCFFYLFADELRRRLPLPLSARSRPSLCSVIRRHAHVARAPIESFSQITHTIIPDRIQPPPATDAYCDELVKSFQIRSPDRKRVVALQPQGGILVPRQIRPRNKEDRLPPGEEQTVRTHWSVKIVLIRWRGFRKQRTRGIVQQDAPLPSLAQ